MARFELNIYGKDDEIVKTYETERLKYGTLLQALKIAEKFDDMTNAQFVEAAQGIVKSVFVGITDEEIQCADAHDVVSIYQQVARASGGVEGGKKN